MDCKQIFVHELLGNYFHVELFPNSLCMKYVIVTLNSRHIQVLINQDTSLDGT